MKLNYPKAWFEQRIEKEGQVEIGAGIPAALAAEPKVKLPEAGIAFGRFVELWRRNKGWNAEKLAAAAGIDPEEVRQIENDPYCEPEPDAVFKLAGVFGLPLQPLLELAGLVLGRALRLREDTPRFCAGVETVAALSDAEREALASMVTALSDGEG